MINVFLSKKIFALIFCFSFFTFLAHTYFTKHAIFADGKFYYSITSSLVKDFDIEFGNDLTSLGLKPTKTTTNYTWNKYPPGAPMFWIPLYYFSDAFSVILNFIGLQVDISGFGIIYQNAIALSTIFLGTFGLYLVYQLLKDYFSEKVSLLTTIALFGTTNLLFYIAVEPINSHGVSFFTSSLFVYYFLNYKDRNYHYLTLGFLGGVAGLVRTQDLLLLILPAVDIFIRHRKSVKNLSVFYLQLAIGTIIGFLPQIYIWKRIYSTIWYSPYVEEGFFFLSPKIGHVLFNAQNGLFILTPIIAVSLIGYFVSPKNKYLSNLLKFYSLSYFISQLYLISSWSSYNQIGSYSIRMIVSTYPLLAIGLALIVKLAKEKVGIVKTFSTVFLLSVINSILVIRYLLLY